MKNYSLLYIYTFIFILSGCNVFFTDTQNETFKKTPALANNAIDLNRTAKEHNEEPQVSDFPHQINLESIAPTGESKHYFSYEGKAPITISLLNTGSKSFLYSVRQIESETIVAQGILKSAETFQRVFKELTKGDYVLSCVVVEEEKPVGIELKLKVELL
ncbi:hypothetical protein ACIQXI_05425 [Lysinibacillus sp. NPDC097195]|uniref:hypothetical protein n=1 Tax=Lysinibacillus sp. NPDC097195 TaxID=3364141 RepID=UPI003821D415